MDKEPAFPITVGIIIVALIVGAVSIVLKRII
ncbi:hypothetical protein PBI_GRAVY_74 [Gordonia phage Gravy]|uniref:Uncharacterized protein n=2 Tax=Tanisvirus tanis TaxID=2844677 RepID=A0A2P1JYI0_9CAUD|nr:hypothetical protein PBI_GRAVY_74 [Gordonia phage Gravy]AVO25406.1 hypothetical protein PBI_KERRY_74 [Gordonia phage Kerry]WNM72546.1 hypothetical protein SEA_ARTORIAS_77 [Gordonia phage Artorias]